MYAQHNGVLQAAPAPRFSASPPANTTTVPTRGEHSAAVLREAGLDQPLAVQYGRYVLQLLHGAGVKMECVSRAELDHVFATLPGIKPADVLFTPNFAPRADSKGRARVAASGAAPTALR